MVRFDWLIALGPVRWERLMVQFDWLIARRLIAAAPAWPLSLSLSLSLSLVCTQFSPAEAELQFQSALKDNHFKILAFFLSKTTKSFIFGYKSSFFYGNSVTRLAVSLWESIRKSEKKNSKNSAIKKRKTWILECLECVHIKHVLNIKTGYYRYGR